MSQPLHEVGYEQLRWRGTVAPLVRSRPPGLLRRVVTIRAGRHQIIPPQKFAYLQAARCHSAAALVSPDVCSLCRPRAGQQAGARACRVCFSRATSDAALPSSPLRQSDTGFKHIQNHDIC